MTTGQRERGAVSTGRWQRAVFLEGRRWAAAAARLAERDGDLAAVVQLALSNGATVGQVRQWLDASGASDSTAKATVQVDGTDE